MILIDALIHDRDLALAEGVVEKAIEVAGFHSQAAGGIAVDHQAGFQAAVLQIGIHILKDRNLFQFRFQTLGPVDKLLFVIALQGVLEGAVADAAADLHILPGLKV